MNNPSVGLKNCPFILSSTLVSMHTTCASLNTASVNLNSTPVILRNTQLSSNGSGFFLVFDGFNLFCLFQLFFFCHFIVSGFSTYRIWGARFCSLFSLSKKNNLSFHCTLCTENVLVFLLCKLPLI